jgi:hypothetical protein
MNEKECPQCHQRKLKEWKELSGDEKFVAERLPMSAEFTATERHLHIYCTNCWYESKSISTMA